MGEGEPKEKDVVWAKVKGYPWWPGIIRHISNLNNYKGISKNKTYIVDFIGNNSHGELTKKDIKFFSQNYEEHCKTKNPSLLKSIQLAKKLYFERNNIDIFKGKNEIKIEKNNKNRENTKKEENGKVNDLLNKKRKKSNSIANNDIKINININVTNNNQRTVNINSFSNINNKENKNKKNKEQRKKEDEEYIFEEEDKNEERINEEEYSEYDRESLENELMDITLNSKINNKYHNNEINIKQNKNKYPILNKKKRLIKGLKKDENEKIKEKHNYEKYDTSFELNISIQELLNYQIQLPNSQNYKLILKELNNLERIMEKEKNLDLFYGQIYKVLSIFTYNKNIEIVSKSADLLSNLTHKIIKDIFVLTEVDKNCLLNEKDINKKNLLDNENNSEENEMLELKKICELISIKINCSDNISIDSDNTRKSKVKNECQKNYMKNYNKKEEIITKNNNKNNNKYFSDIIFNIITNNLRDDFYKISENFFKNIYNKKDNGLDKNFAQKRKAICIKLFSLFKKVFPKVEEEFLKKIILFFEYKIRLEDPTLNQKYLKEVDNLLYKIKDIINEKNKDNK